ncbi:type II secretion system GspH family protein [Patescibacteria group bacterium]|nr:type II secretion system GspH family protein [Patescibacteria group bacterium]
MNKTKSKRGETLIEVLISVTSLILISTAASMTIMASIKGTQLSKEYLVAQNLSAEAKEIINNIRDTNWLMCPTKKEECWNIADSQGSSDCNCSGKAKIEDGSNYYTIQGNNKEWHLEKETPILDLENSPELATSYALCREVLEDNVYNYISCLQDGTDLDNAAFYRSITVTGESESSLNIGIKIQWYSGTQINTLHTSALISNSL